MSRRKVALVTAGVVLAALLAGAPRVLAGEHVRAAQPAPHRSQPAPVVVYRPVTPPVTISLTPAAPAAGDSATISLRGPDGQVRRFAVEGGAEEVSARVIVLRPGESLTIRLTANKK